MRIAGLIIIGLFVSLAAFSQQEQRQLQPLNPNQVVPNSQGGNGGKGVIVINNGEEKKMKPANEVVPAGQTRETSNTQGAAKRDLVPIDPNKTVKTKK